MDELVGGTAVAGFKRCGEEKISGAPYNREGAPLTSLPRRGKRSVADKAHSAALLTRRSVEGNFSGISWLNVMPDSLKRI